MTACAILGCVDPGCQRAAARSRVPLLLLNKARDGSEVEAVVHNLPPRGEVA